MSNLTLKYGPECFYQASLAARRQPLAERRFVLTPYPPGASSPAPAAD